ncbi:MAG: SBBP repeat-containing protein [Blastocatellia bacterium]|nr:SBBP repeat-containing protein [Blastocatellia bacterium]
MIRLHKLLVPLLLGSFGWIPGLFPIPQADNAANHRFVRETRHHQVPPTALALSRLPAVFEEVPAPDRKQPAFVHRTSSHSVFLTAAGFSIRTSPANDQPASCLRLEFAGAARPTIPIGTAQTSSVSHYFLGNDRRKWHCNMPNFARIQYPNLYRGVDVLVYGQQNQLEYDFVVAPGIDPAVIRLRIPEVRTYRLDSSGDLILTIGGIEIRQAKPVCYQIINGKKQSVSGAFRLFPQNPQTSDIKRQTSNVSLLVGFSVGAYDRSQPLVIDPVVTFATVLGGSGQSAANAVALDREGNLYVTGTTDAVDFPTTFTTPQRGQRDVFVTKINPAGTEILYSTYLGGSFSETGYGIAVDATGRAVLAGEAISFDFPTTEKAVQPALNGFADGITGDAFVTKLSPNGDRLEFSTFLGGKRSDLARSLALDANGNVLIAGETQSEDFPVVQAAQSKYGQLGDGFVAKLNAAGTELVYSTYLGGNEFDAASCIVTDRLGNAYVTGRTATVFGFPSPQPFDFPYGGGATDAFLVKLPPTGAPLAFSRYFGGTGADSGNAIAVDTAGNILLAGETASGRFPTFNPLQGVLSGPSDAFVSKFDPTGSRLLFSTYLGGSNSDRAHALAIDGAGNVFVAGETSSSDFPVENPVQGEPGDLNADGFIARLNPTGSKLEFSTYLGGTAADTVRGLALDARQAIRVAGTSFSSNFPVRKPLLPYPREGGSFAFVTTIAQIIDPPATPLGLKAIAQSDSRIFLQWQAGGDDQTGFVVERSLTASDSFVPAGRTAAAVTSFIDDGLESDTTYFYRIRASNPGGLSVPTSPVSVTTFESPDQEPPTVHLLVPNGGEQVTAGQKLAIAWTSTDNRGVSTHQLDLSTDGGARFALPIAANLAGNVTAFSFQIPSDVTSATTRVRVLARDVAGNEGSAISQTDFTIHPPDTIAPTVRLLAPNGGEKLKAGKSFTVVWQAADNVGIRHQELRISTDGGKTFSVVIVSGLAGTVRMFDFQIPATHPPSKTVRMRVLATDAAGNTGQDDSDGDFIFKKPAQP